MKRVMFVALLLGATGWAQSGMDNSYFGDRGNDFLQRCDAPNAPEKATAEPIATEALLLACTAYVDGVIEGVNVLYLALKTSAAAKRSAPDQLICAPAGVTRRQQKDVVIKYIKEHPEKAHLMTAALMLYATRDAFPCNTAK